MLAVDFRPSWPLKSARMAATHCCASHGRGRPRHRRFAYFARFAAVSQMARRRDAFTGFALQGTPSADYSPSPSALLARSGRVHMNTTKQRKIRKTKKDKSLKLHVDGWNTTDADEIERRRLRAQSEKFRIKNTDATEPFFSSFWINSLPNR